MKIATLPIAFLLAATTARAETLTPCAGSFDGVGFTACELLGAPGDVGAASGVDWTAYDFASDPLYEISAYNDSNAFRVDQLGQIVYQRGVGGRIFSTLLHRKHFALWPRGQRGVLVGVEDLADDDPGGSDWDYQDYMVEAWTTEDTPVPEPAAVALLAFGAAAWIRRRKR